MVRFGALGAGNIYGVDAIEYDFLEHIGAYTGPVLAFQGDADTMEPPACTTCAMGCYAQVDYEIIPGAGHGFHDAVQEHVIERVAAFVAEHARPADGWA